ncbi:MAG TPA: type I glyceraldehyde-3-phosphate dehydrogenase [Candidatus Saccharibacteria bacterium]|nr:type I glyceraldehyde-3-phosphate dehydrogenase [Candidatus Saccharibacteria bacterium]
MGQIKIGINGFGRIGRNAFKIAFERNDVEVVAINDLFNPEVLAYMLKHDSNYGTYEKEITFGNNEIIVDGKIIKAFSENSPGSIPWGGLGVDVVIESTGQFTTKDNALKHIEAGAKRVVVGNSIDSEDIDTIIIGVNEELLKQDIEVISNATPTTNSIAAILSVLDGEFGVQKSLLTTIHSYTSSQKLTDHPFRNFREGRNAAENIVPSVTGATTALKKVLPQFGDKFDGLSVRVPTPVVSLSDLTVLLGRNTTIEEINDVITNASKEPYYQGIIDINNELLVSRDYIGNSHSGVVDLKLTKLVDGNLAKIMVWYDNEWGFGNRLVELAVDAGRTLYKDNIK